MFIQYKGQKQLGFNNSFQLLIITNYLNYLEERTKYGPKQIKHLYEHVCLTDFVFLFFVFRSEK